MAKISDPFSAYNIPPRPVANIPGQPPKFTPGVTSPLDQTARNFSPRVSVESAQEQRRAEQLPGNIAAANAAPRFGDKPTPPPFPPRTSAPVPAPREAGGSKSNGNKS